MAAAAMDISWSDPDSGSDDQDCPTQEPEFAIHVVDDDDDRHRRPPARRPSYQLPQPPSPLQHPQPDYTNRRRKKALTLFIIMLVHFAPTIALAVATGVLAWYLPKELGQEGAGAYRVLCLFCIGMTALSWFTVGFFKATPNASSLCAIS